MIILKKFMYVAVHDLKNISTKMQLNKTNSVDNFSKEQRSRALEVIKLHYSLDHPSNYNLIKALNNGLILGTRLVEADVHNAEKLYSKCINCVAGKVNDKALL